MPRSDRSRDHVIRDVRQLEAISEPTRQQIISLMEQLGEASIPELARRLGRAPEALYHHARRLESVGLLVRAGAAPTGRRHRAVYRLPGARVRVDVSNRSKKYVAALRQAARAVFRLAERLADAALADGRCRFRGPHANVRVQQLTARLRPRDVRRAVALLQELDGLMLDGGRDDAGAVYTLTYGFTPLLDREAG